MRNRCRREDAWKRARRMSGIWRAAPALAALLVARPARCDDWWLLQGLVDAEAWNTSGGSELLERNEDKPGSAGALRLSAGAQPLAGLQLFARGALEGGKASESGQTETSLELAFVRY